MSQTSDQVLYALGQNAAVVGHLDNYLSALEPEEENKLHALSETALFSDDARLSALTQFGRLDMIRELRRHLEPYVRQHKQQYTR